MVRALKAPLGGLSSCPRQSGDDRHPSGSWSLEGGFEAITPSLPALAGRGNWLKTEPSG
ncbi:hypothetical protein [Thermococcus sp.]